MLPLADEPLPLMPPEAPAPVVALPELPLKPAEPLPEAELPDADPEADPAAAVFSFGCPFASRQCVAAEMLVPPDVAPEALPASLDPDTLLPPSELAPGAEPEP